MIIRTRAPLRISFAGGGTDLNEVFEKYGGEVINATIDKYVYVEIGKGKGVKVNGKTPDNFTAQILKRLKINNISINTWYEIPFGRGLANSSAYSVALTKAIYLYKNSHRTKKEIVEKVFGIENSLGKCGWQDQYACVYGGFNHLELSRNKKEIVNIKIDKKTLYELEKCLCLVYTGKTHNSTQVQLKKKPLKKQKIKKIKYLVYQTFCSLCFDEPYNIAKILNEGWKLKKDKAITNKNIENLYQFGFKCGAIGGKLLGAGDGGYILFFIMPNKMMKFREQISKKHEILNFKFTNKGVEAW